MANIYSNRYASMEKQPCGGWVVYSRVAGLPLDEYGRLSDGTTPAKIHRDYNSARETMVNLTNRYKSINRGY